MMSERIYGRRPVAEAERGRRRVHRVWRAPDTPPEELERLCGSPDHQGVVAEVDPYPYADPGGLLEKEDALVVVLDQVQDPHNLGAVCRAAEVAGVSGVVIPERRAASVTPAVCKASAGAVEHLPVARVRNIADWLGEAKRAGAWVYGAAAEAELPYTDVDWSGRAVLALGSEGSGLRSRVADACDELISIPAAGRIDSLNASVAAAVIIFEARRQRGAGRAGLGRELFGRPQSAPRERASSSRISMYRSRSSRSTRRPSSVNAWSAWPTGRSVSTTRAPLALSAFRDLGLRPDGAEHSGAGADHGRRTCPRGRSRGVAGKPSRWRS